MVQPKDDDTRLQDLRQFPLDVAHDLRGPLAGIGMLARVAQQHLQRGEVAAALEGLQRIAEQAQSSQLALEALWRLADDLQRPLQTRERSLDEIAQAAAAEAVLSLQAQRPGQPLPQLQLQPLDQARVDAGLVHLILVNLIGNALKFNLGHDQVHVRVHREAANPEAGLVLVVSDDGVGFEVGAVPTGLAPGHGMGLSIVRRAAKRLGGQVRVTSSPGRGATIRVALPAL